MDYQIEAPGRAAFLTIFGLRRGFESFSGGEFWMFSPDRSPSVVGAGVGVAAARADWTIFIILDGYVLRSPSSPALA